MAKTAPARAEVKPLDFLDIDYLLQDEERVIRDTVRQFVRDRVLPGIEQWFEKGVFPKEVAPELGRLGLLGMHLHGYGCLGSSATSYGIACLELEAGDSGFRSFVSVQGSLAMFPIWKYGSEEQKQEWLPRMAAGEAIGCFGLTEPDSGSDPASMRTAARRDGSDWVLNGNKLWITNGGIADLAGVWARGPHGVPRLIRPRGAKGLTAPASMRTAARRDGSDWVLNGNKLWITNGGIADLAVVWARGPDGIRGFIVPRGAKGFTTRDIHKKLSLRASVTSELILEDVRLP